MSWAIPLVLGEENDRFRSPVILREILRETEDSLWISLAFS